MLRKKREGFVLAAMALVIVASACGESSTSPSAQSPASPALPNLERFLARANDVQGFPPSGEVETISGVRAIVDEFKSTKADEKRLRDNGFQVFVVQHLGGPSDDGAGVSNVSLFTTEDGAARELQHLLAEIPKDKDHPVIKRFDVPGVPTATGFTQNKPENESVVVDVSWTQGRCLMTVGTEPAYEDRVRAGVRAIYERTNGRCP